MKRALLAIFCCAFLLAVAPSAYADPVFDQDMASRYLRAAQSGDDEAQFYLGALYAAGVGVPRSDQEAFRWFSRAADQGHSHAMLLVAGFYATGRGVEKNNVEAYKWAFIVNGASRVDEFRDVSNQLMTLIGKRMSSEDLARAKGDAGRWHAAGTGRTTPTAPPAPKADYSRTPPVAPAPTPTADYSRTTPVAPAPTPTVAAAPPAAAPPPAAPTPEPSKSSSTDNPMDAFGKNFSKGDVDDFLKEMPAMRKKFGF